MCMHISLTSSSELDMTSSLENVQSNELTVTNCCEDCVVNEQMKDSIKMVDGHFQLLLLWRQESFWLLKNWPMVENQLVFLKKHFSRNTELHDRYTNVIESYLHKGYAEKAELNEDSARSEWYLLHSPVFNLTNWRNGGLY